MITGCVVNLRLVRAVCGFRYCKVRMKHRARLVVAVVAILTVLSITKLVKDLPSTDRPGLEPSSHTAVPVLEDVMADVSNTLPVRHITKRPSGRYLDMYFKDSPGLRAVYGKDSGASDTSRKTLNRTQIIDNAINRLLQEINEQKLLAIDSIRRADFKSLTRTLGKSYKESSPYLPRMQNKKFFPDSPSYLQFYHGIQKYSMYGTGDGTVEKLLHDMATQKIVAVDSMTKGTELKLLITFRDGCKAVFKPKRWERDYETLPNHFYFNDFERHNAEIAGFHLSRLLGFNSVPPVTGRVLNMTRDIYLLTDQKLRKTFYISPVGNMCFYGTCTYYCDSRHAFCGRVDQLEGSLMVFLPDERDAKRSYWKSPYRRSYSRMRTADWEKDPQYCNERVKPVKPFKGSSQLLLNLVDTHIFDFLTGNMDRHHLEFFQDFGNDSFAIHLDNGRGFGKIKHDELSILTPLRQCCVIRESTLVKLLNLYLGPKRLGELLDESMRADPVYPIVLGGHLTAIDRRVRTIIYEVAVCVRNSKSLQDVIRKNPI